MHLNKTIFIRHANRKYISAPKDFSEGGLTLNGKLHAIKAGRFLKSKYKISEIHTSKRKRCYETAQLISLAYSPLKRMPIISELNEPDTLCASFVKNIEEWNHLCMNEEFLSMFFTNTEDLFERYYKFNLFRYDSTTTYTEEVLQKYLLEKNILAITHDFTITPLLVGLSIKLGFQLDGHNGRPLYLTGIIVHHTQKKIKKIESINTITGITLKIYEENSKHL